MGDQPEPDTGPDVSSDGVEKTTAPTRLLVGTALLVVVAIVAILAIRGGNGSPETAGGDTPGSTAQNGRPGGSAPPVAVQPMPDGSGPIQPLPQPPSSQPMLQPGEPDPTTSSGGAIAEYRVVEVHDPMIENFRAISLLVPVGWQVQGGIHWEPNLHPLAAATLTITDPAGAYVLETFFPLRFSWIDDPMYQHPGMNWLGAIMAPPRGAAQAVQDFVLPHFRPNAQVVGTLPIETANLGGDYDGVRLRVRYSTPNGDIEEEFLAITSYASMTSGATFTQWGFEMLYSVRGPAGELDRMLPTFGTISASFDIDPLWFSNYLTVMEMFMARGYEGIRLAGELSQYLTRTNAEISRIHQETWENQQRTYDRLHDNFVDYIRDTQKVGGANGGPPRRTPSGVACQTADGTILVFPHGSTCPPDTTHLPTVQ